MTENWCRITSFTFSFQFLIWALIFDVQTNYLRFVKKSSFAGKIYICQWYICHAWFVRTYCLFTVWWWVKQIEMISKISVTFYTILWCVVKDQIPTYLIPMERCFLMKKPTLMVKKEAYSISFSLIIIKKKYCVSPCITMLYITFQYGWEQVLIQRILLGFEAILEK